MEFADILKYLQGKTSKKESEKIRAWIVKPENEKEVREILIEIWLTNDIKFKKGKPDFDQIMNKVLSRIEKPETEISLTQEKLRKIYSVYSKIAAVFLIPIIIFSAYLIFYDAKKQDENVITAKEIYTKPGTTTKIGLADGTKVWLNDKTVFRYPEKFTGNKREVFIDGEAYFEVEANKKSPFVVQNPMMKTIVTGTHFNLNAYSEDAFFEATLLEGKISLEAGNDQYNLNPGAQLQYNVATSLIKERNIQTGDAIAWIDGKLFIYNETLDIAARKLSRWFNVAISISDAELKEYELTCKLENENLAQSLNMLSYALPLKYEIKETKINNYAIKSVVLMKK